MPEASEISGLSFLKKTAESLVRIPLVHRECNRRVRDALEVRQGLARPYAGESSVDNIPNLMATTERSLLVTVLSSSTSGIEHSEVTRQFSLDRMALEQRSPGLARLATAFFITHDRWPVTPADLEQDQPYFAGVLRVLKKRLGSAEAVCRLLVDPNLDPYILAGKSILEVAEVKTPAPAVEPVAEPVAEAPITDLTPVPVRTTWQEFEDLMDNWPQHEAELSARMKELAETEKGDFVHTFEKIEEVLRNQKIISEDESQPVDYLRLIEAVVQLASRGEKTPPQTNVLGELRAQAQERQAEIDRLARELTAAKRAGETTQQLNTGLAEELKKAKQQLAELQPAHLAQAVINAHRNAS